MGRADRMSVTAERRERGDDRRGWREGGVIGAQVKSRDKKMR